MIFSQAYLLNGTYILILVLLVTESIITLYLTYWFSKAVCRQFFNTLVCHFAEGFMIRDMIEHDSLCLSCSPSFF